MPKAPAMKAASSSNTKKTTVMKATTKSGSAMMKASSSAMKSSGSSSSSTAMKTTGAKTKTTAMKTGAKASVMKGSSLMKKKAMASAMKKKITLMKKKVMKVKVMKIGRKWQVFSGTRTKTQGGLNKESLTLNSTGKVVSKKRSDLAKSRYQQTVKPWLECAQKARQELKITGMVPIGGKSEAGQKFYARAKMLYDKMKGNMNK